MSGTRDDRKWRSSSRSFAGTATRRAVDAPRPPPRSAPATWRRPRRDVGDVVRVTCPSSVILVEYKCANDQLVRPPATDIAVAAAAEERPETPNYANASVGNNGCARRRAHVPVLVNKFVMGAFESQEVNFYIGNFLFRNRSFNSEV